MTVTFLTPQALAAKNQAVAFTYTEGNLAISVEYKPSGVTETAYIRGRFTSLFRDSTLDEESGTVTLRRRLGWPGRFEVIAQEGVLPAITYAPVNYTAATSDVEDHFEGIDNALGALDLAVTAAQTAADDAQTDATQALADAAAKVPSVYGRTGVITAQTGDYTSTQITNSSSVAGTGVTGALNTLLSAITALVTGVSSVFGRTGAVSATAGDYNSTQVTNSSDVAGSWVTTALNNLLAYVKGFFGVASGASYNNTTYTFVIGDAGQICIFNNGSSTTITVPTNASVAFPVGTIITCVQAGAGQLTFTSSATIRATDTLKSREQYATVALIKIATDEWVLTGETASS